MLTIASYPASAKRYYFDYSDCDSACNGSFCIIFSAVPNLFLPCTELDFMCRNSASPDAVCMHPNAPPIGGQSLWPAFRDQHPTPKLPLSSSSTLWITTIISLVSNLLFLATLLAKGLRKCFYRTGYERIDQIANPSPSPSLSSISINSN